LQKIAPPISAAARPATEALPIKSEKTPPTSVPAGLLRQACRAQPII